MKFARLVFLIAGIYGLIGLVPQYFMEGTVGADHPAGLTHPEFFYAFLGVGIAWQIAFVIMSSDPVRFRPLIIPAIFEKFSFGIPAVVLFCQHRVPGVILGAGIGDLIWGVLFIVAWRKLSANISTPQP